MTAQGRRTLLLLFYVSLVFCLIAPVNGEQYDLTTTINISQGGTVWPDCTTPQTCWYNSGSSAHLIAIPNGGYVFDKWEGDCEGNNPSVRVIMTGPRTCMANFLYCTAQPLKRGSFYFDSFRDAYMSATSGDTIQALATTLVESLRLDRDDIKVTLRGGYRC